MRTVYGRERNGLQTALGSALLLMVGCASPGRPLPPSLKLPAVVKDLRAERVGGAVELQWTTPTETTDGVGLKGDVATEICREVVTSPAVKGGEAPCTVVRRVSVAPGVAAAAVDALPAGLTVDPVRALVYRVRLLNGKGHSAGVSNAAYAAGGEAPAEVRGLRAESVAAGVRLEWTRGSGPESAMALRRVEVGSAGAGKVPGKRSGLPGARVGGAKKEERGVQRMEVALAGGDPGGTIDATAVRDASYGYWVTRVRAVEVAGERLTLRGPESAEVMVRVRDVAAPAVPTGLAAVADGGVVALSWEPSFEGDLVGYRVYRAAVTGAGLPETMPPAAPWERLTAQPVAVPAFRDALPHGGTFVYRVTAVDGSGNESAAGAAVQVESAGPQP